MLDLLIFPFNGNGIEALQCLDNKTNFIGFIDDAKDKQGLHRFGFHVYSRAILKKYPGAKVLVASFKVQISVDQVDIINSGISI